MEINVRDPYAFQRDNGRWTGMYHHANERRPKSAGTYDDYDTALATARAMQQHVNSGATDGVDPVTKATITIAEYAPIWLRNHVVEPTTRANYDSVMTKHIVPALGHERVSQLQRQTVRAHLSKLNQAGVGAVTQKRVRDILSAMMQTAWDDGYRGDNPARSIKGKKIKHKMIVVLTKEQFQRIHEQLPTRGARLLARTVVNTGLRFGEVTALRPSDIDVDKMVLNVGRAVQDPGAKYHPNGRDRFHLADYTKTKTDRQIAINKATLKALLDWIADVGIEADEVIFPRHLVVPNDGRTRPRKNRPPLTPEYIATLGTFTGPNGKDYQHGTVNGYVTGRCRRECCRQAMTEYKKARNARLRATKSPAAEGQPFMGRDSWGRVWRAACAEAGLSNAPTAYQLRHTHASWLIRAGVDPETVMVRLGHTSLAVTTRYVGMVDDGRSAADAMDDLGLDLDD